MQSEPKGFGFFLEDLIQYCNIMIDIQNKGKEHLEKLKEMRYSCAFQSEIESEYLHKGELNGKVF